MRSFIKGKSLYILLLNTVVTLTSCTFQVVEVTDIQSVEFTEFSQKKISIAARVKVYNPNNFSISITDSDVALYLADNYTGQAKILDEPHIPAGFDDYLPVKIQADMSSAGNSILPVLMSGLLKRSVHVKAEGYITARHFIFSKKVPLEFSEDVHL